MGANLNMLYVNHLKRKIELNNRAKKMERLTAKLEEFNQEVIKRIEKLLKSKGVQSHHHGSSKKVICVESEDTMFNLEGGRWLMELNEEELIDNKGYTYSHDALSLENLCIVIDEIENA